MTLWPTAAANNPAECARVHKDEATGEVTMRPMTDDERMAALPAFAQQYVASRGRSPAPTAVGATAGGLSGSWFAWLGW